MTDRDDKDEKTPKDSTAETEAPEQAVPDADAIISLFGDEGEEESEVQAEIRSEFEKAATEVIQKHLGLPLKEDGTPDTSQLTQEQLEASMPELAYEMLTTYLKTIKPIVEERVGKAKDTAALTDVEERKRRIDELDLDPVQKEFLKSAADDVRLVLAFLGQRSDRLGEDLERLVDRVKKVLVEKLAEVLEAQGFAEGKLPPLKSLSKESVQASVANKLLTLIRKLGEKMEASPRPYEPPTRPPWEEVEPAQSVTPAPVAEMSAAEQTGPPSGDEVEAGEATEEPVDGGEVIDLDEARKRLGEKRGKMSNLEDALTRFLVDSGIGGDKPVNLNFDQEFFKEHGPSIIQKIVDGLSKAWSPPKVELTLPMASDEAKSDAKKAESDAETGAEGAPEVAEGEKKKEGQSAVKVSLNLDIGNILGRLFKTGSPRTAGEDPSEDDNSADT